MAQRSLGAFAVLRFITGSNLVGCTIGRSWPWLSGAYRLLVVAGLCWIIANPNSNTMPMSVR
jgi:hypothetical protein